MSDSNNVRLIVKSYLSNGWSPIPIPDKSKAPNMKEWTKLRVKADEIPKYFNEEKQNVGVLLGKVSENLVDIDLEWPETVALADTFLPSTSAKFGRNSKQKSHWLYQCKDLPKTRKFQLSESLSTGTEHDLVPVEVRTTGQTLFPPSVHPSGEEIYWNINGNMEPAVVDREELTDAVNKLALAAVLTRFYPSEGKRNDAALAITSIFLQGGLSPTETELYVSEIARVAGDEEWKQRGNNVEKTAEKIANKEPVTGSGRIEELMGEGVACVVREWLGEKNKGNGKGKKNETLPPQSVVGTQLSNLFRDNITYDVTSENWYKFDNKIWVKNTEHSVFQRIIHEINTQYQGIGYSYAYISGVASFINKLNCIEKWEQSKEYLPLENGVLNLTTMELEEHKPDLCFNWILPYPYNVLEDCPTTKKWLLETVGGDEGMVQILRAWMNAVIKGRTDLQKYLETIGPGGTGKSTFQRLVSDLIGENNRAVTELKEIEQNRFEAASIYGKRLLQITDEKGFTGNVDKLKAITGQDPIRYEQKNKQQGASFTASCMVMIAANENIQSADYTSGLERRRLTLFFEHQPDVVDRDLQSSLRKELSGILNWCLELSDAKVTEIISNPSSVSSAAANMKFRMLLETNPIIAWIHTNIVLDENVETNIGNKSTWHGELQNTSIWLYPNYLEWCEAQNNNPLSVKKFSPTLFDVIKSQLKIPVTKLSGRDGSRFRGIRIRKRNDDDMPSPVTGFGLDLDVMSGDGLVMDRDNNKTQQRQDCVMDVMDVTDQTQFSNKRYPTHNEGADNSLKNSSSIKNGDNPSHPSHPSQPPANINTTTITQSVTNPSHVKDFKKKFKYSGLTPTRIRRLEKYHQTRH
ncbi:MAG: bifunctional DNA primase/polymerase [Magnetococcales bacterium]|nr:bifunctional DNA primase/polymerase [Magnetococcales bacterium]